MKINDSNKAGAEGARRAQEARRAKKGDEGRPRQAEQRQGRPCFRELLDAEGRRADTRPGAPSPVAPRADRDPQTVRVQTMRDQGVREERRESHHQLTEAGACADPSGIRRAPAPDDDAPPPAIPLDDGALPLPCDHRPANAPLAAASSAPPRAELDQVIRQMVRAVQVGEDLRARKTVLLEVEVPGRGQVHIRLRSKGRSYELRMRAEDAALARDLRAHRGVLRERSLEQGLTFSRIDIVG